MALPTPVTGETVEATDITDIKAHLEGSVGETAPWHFRQSSGNFIVTLSTNDGTTKVSLHDSDGVEVFAVDSNGNITLSGSVAATTFIFPLSASPSQTTEGQGAWDTDDDLIAVGSGSTTKLFQPFNKGTDIASATTLTLANDRYYHITGVTTVTGLGTKPAGYEVTLEFDSVLTLTHNATSFILAGGASRNVQAKDTAVFISEGSGNWREVSSGRNTLESMVRGFVQDGSYQTLFWYSGIPAGSSTTGTPVGVGCSIFLESSASFAQNAGTGLTQVSTTAANGNEVGVFGPGVPGGRSFVVNGRLMANSAASQSVFMGMGDGSGYLDTQPNQIGIRVNGTGNYIGFCDSGGTETTRDTSALPDGTTLQRFTIVRNGSTVQFFRNGVQVGADVTTNITASNLTATCGIQALTNSIKSMFFTDFCGMGAAS